MPPVKDRVGQALLPVNRATDTFEVVYRDPELSYKFFKVSEDRIWTYGDGGRTCFIMPLYHCPCLRLPNSVKLSLFQTIKALALKRNDWHDDAPILDIIDPDLAPNYCAPGCTGVSERQKYAWFPSTLQVEPNGRCKFLSPIHTLKLDEHEALHSSLSRLFSALVPGFRKLGLVSKTSPKQLQVVVKVQRYEIQPNSSYSGKWHVEGRTENIVAAGVYYLKISEEFEQDRVVFRTPAGPDPSYARLCGCQMEYEIDIRLGTAIVFSNLLPHRFKELKNSTAKPLSRLLINFFIVDPNKPLPSTALYHIHMQWLSVRLSSVLAHEILKYLVFLPDLAEAKERRQLARQSMKTAPSGWGYIHYGNCGDVEFLTPTDERIEKMMRVEWD